MSSDFRHFLIVLILLSIMTLGVLSCGKTEDEVKTSSSDNQTTNLCNPTCKGLVAHYTFNGNSLNSASENYHAITKDNSTQPSLVSDRNGNSFSSYKFDGVDDYLYVDDVTDLKLSEGSFSLVTWIKVNGYHPYDYTGDDGREWTKSDIFSTDSNLSTLIEFGRWNNYAENSASIGFITDVTRWGLNSNIARIWVNGYYYQYFHLSTVFDRNNKKLIVYVDTKKLGDKSWVGETIDPITKFHFGINARWMHAKLIGQIDDFQIYNKALTQSEVIELYQSSSYDTYSPTITSISPSDNDSSISVTDNLSITFSETMDNSSITINTSDTSCSGTVQVSSDNFSTCVQMSSSYSVSNSNKTFTFDPSDNLSYLTTYKIRVTSGVKDVFGNEMESQFKGLSARRYRGFSKF